MIAEFIKANPGCSRNAILREIGGGGSSFENALGGLVRQNIVRREIDDHGYHHYYADVPPGAGGKDSGSVPPGAHQNGGNPA
jgi:hypothetical protein